MDLLQFLAWAVVHIGVPIFAPIALLPLLGVTRTFRQSARGVVYNAVKNGQLLWIVIAMSSEGCYELAGYLESAASNGRELAWTGLGSHVFLIVMSAVLVMLGAIDGLNESADVKDARLSRIMLLSILVATVSAFIFAEAHYLIGRS
jgi:hypothetical protein